MKKIFHSSAKKYFILVQKIIFLIFKMNLKYLIGGIVGLVILYILYKEYNDSSPTCYGSYDSHGVWGNKAMIGKNGSLTGWGASSTCPPPPVCEKCPCPPSKECPSCEGIPGFWKYGPASIKSTTPSGSYTCVGTTVQGYCVLPDDQAPSVCLADPNCIGILKIDLQSNVSQLINSQPSNDGESTSTIYFEKQGNTPPPTGDYSLTVIYPQASGTSLIISQPMNRSNIGKTIIINVSTTTAVDPLRTAVLNVKNIPMTITNISATGTTITVGLIPQIGGQEGRATVTGSVHIQ